MVTLYIVNLLLVSGGEITVLCQLRVLVLPIKELAAEYWHAGLQNPLWCVSRRADLTTGTMFQTFTGFHVIMNLHCSIRLLYASEAVLGRTQLSGWAALENFWGMCCWPFLREWALLRAQV